MVEKGWLSAADAATMTLPAFAPIDTSNKFGGQTGYIVHEVRQELADAGFTDSQIDGGGLNIVSTVNPDAQADLVAAVQAQAPKSGTDGLRIGAASVDPATGGVIAMYGGPDYVTNSLNNATQATAQAGSTFKPFALAAAFEKDISAVRAVQRELAADDRRVHAGEREQQVLRPNLVEARHRGLGEHGLREPGQRGRDRQRHQRGAPGGFARGHRGGQRRPHVRARHREPVAARHGLGVRDVRGSGRVPGAALRGFRDRAPTARCCTTGTKAAEQRFEPDIADQVNDALHNVVTGGTATKALAVGRPVAGKTGTTDENKSAWFVGYAPQVSTAVMLMKEDASGNPVTLRGVGGVSKVHGNSFPLSIWTAYNKAYLKGLPVEEFVKPKQSTQSTPTTAPRNRWNTPRSVELSVQLANPVPLADAQRDAFRRRRVKLRPIRSRPWSRWSRSRWNPLTRA